MKPKHYISYFFDYYYPAHIKVSQTHTLDLNLVSVYIKNTLDYLYSDIGQKNIMFHIKIKPKTVITHNGEEIKHRRIPKILKHMEVVSKSEKLIAKPINISYMNSCIYIYMRVKKDSHKNRLLEI
jgi:hypothetical protein